MHKTFVSYSYASVGKMDILKELEEKVHSNSDASYYYKIENQVAGINTILRKIRLSKNISQIQIAKETGLSKQMVSKMECYNGNPTLTSLVKYCDCIGIDLLELLSQELQKKV